MTVPSQLRSLLRAADADAEAAFRALAPQRGRVAIQRWTLRRFGLTFAVEVAGFVAVSLIIANLRLAGPLRAGFGRGRNGCGADGVRR